MMLFPALWLWLSASVQAQSGPSAVEIRQQVTALMDDKFKAFPSDRRIPVTDQLISSLASVADGDRRASLLRDLPNAVQYYSSMASLPEFMAPGLNVDPSSQLEGYDVQASYLSAVVARAASIEWTPQIKAAIADQIGVISNTAKSSLLAKIGGEGAAQVVDTAVDLYAKQCLASLEVPFSAYLDRPLSTEELTRVTDGISHSIVDALPMTVSKDQANNPRMLSELGVMNLLGKVQEACWKATAVCFAEFDPLEQRSNEYLSQMKKRATTHFLESGKDYVAEARKKLPPPKRLSAPGRAPKAPAPGLSEDPSQPHVTATPATSVAVHEPQESPAGISPRQVIPYFLLAVAAAVLAWSLKAKKAGPRP